MNQYKKNNLYLKIPKIWNSWIPKMSFFSYEIFYTPSLVRSKLRSSNFMLKIKYNDYGSFLFFVPKGVFISLIKKGRLLTGSSYTSRDRQKLKPFVSSVLVTLLGYTFRFKLFLKVKGLGYKAYVSNSGKVLSLKLGLSHVVNFNFKNEMFAETHGTKDRMFSVEGSNWVTLTNTISRIKKLRRIDYYRGKGIFNKFNSCKIRESRKKK